MKLKRNPAKKKEQRNKRIFFTAILSSFLSKYRKIIFSVLFCVIILLLAFAAWFELSHSRKEIFIIKNTTTIALKQIVAGLPVKLVTLVDANEIKNGKHLVKIPKNATGITIKKVTPQEIRDIKSNQRLQISDQDRVEMIKKIKNPPFFSKLFKSVRIFLGNAEEVADIIIADIIPENNSQLVDVSGIVPEAQSDIQPEIQQPEAPQEQPQEESQSPEETTEIAPTILEEAPDAEPQPIIIESESTPEPIAETTEEQPAITEPEPIIETTSTSVVEVINTEPQPVVETSAGQVQPEPASQTETPCTGEETDNCIAIEYTVPAPIIEKEPTDNGQLVTVSSQNETVPLTDVLAYTTIPEIYKVGEENKIKIKWKSNNDEEMRFIAKDLDNNGLVDYLEWVVPHLSEQMFEIIFISKAFKLDADKNILADIYEETKLQDDNWASLQDGQYIRATFEKVLDNTKDNTIYAKPTDPNQPVTIEVYPVYTDADGNQTEGPIVATFESIDHEDTYKVLLTDLQTPTDVFDLKIIGNIDIDYIVDPGTTYYWVGGAGASYNSATNWSTTSTACGTGDGAVPGASDLAVFDANCVNSASIDSNWSVVGIQIDASYTGTITQSGSSTLTIGATGYSQSDGVFTGGTGTITLTGPFALAGGTFTLGAQTVNTTGNWTYTSGTLDATTNNSTVSFDDANLAITGSHALRNVTFTGYYKTYTIAEGTTLTVVGTLSLSPPNSWSDTRINTGTINSQGNITVTQNGVGGTATINIVGTGNQTLTGSSVAGAGALPKINIAKDSGTLYLSGTILTTSDWTYTKGTVDASTNASTVVFSGYYSALTITGSHTLNNVTLGGTNTTYTIAGGTTLTVAGTLGMSRTAWSGSKVNTGTINAQGDINQTVFGLGGTATININGTGDQTFTGSGDVDNADSPAINIAKDSGTLYLSGTIRMGAEAYTSKDWTYTKGIINTTTYDSTIIFNLYYSTINITGSHTLDNVKFDGYGTIIVANGTTLTTAGNFAITSAQYSGVTVNTGILNVQGNMTMASNAAGGTTALTFSGGNTQSFTNSGGTLVGGAITINKTVGSSLNLATALSANTAGQDLTITSGTLNLASYALTVNDQFAIGANGTLALQGGETINKQPTAITSGGTIEYNATSSSRDIKNWTYTNAIVKINGSGGTFTLPANLSATSVTLAAGTFDSNGYNITLSANWTNSGGSFDCSSGTVTFTGSDSTGTINVMETEIFNNLIVTGYRNNVNITAGDTLVVLGTFTHTSTYYTYLNTGTVEVRGSMVVGSATGSGGTATVSFLVAGDQTITASGGTTVNININKPSGTVSASGNFKVSNFTLAGGAFTSTTGTLTVTGNWTHTDGGTFNHGSGTVTFTGSDSTGTINVMETETFNNLTVTGYRNAVNITAGDTLVVLGTFTHTSSYYTSLNTGILEVRGNVVIGPNSPDGTASLIFSGGNAQTYNRTSGTLVGGTITINKDVGTSLTLLSALSANTAGQDLTITSGTLNLASYALTVNDQFAIGANGTLALQGAETINKQPTAITSGGTIEYNATSGSRDIKNWTYTNAIVKINGTGGTFTLPANLSATSVTLAAGTLDSNSHDISLSGNWTNSGGSFTYGVKRVTLTTGTHALSGATTFYDFTINAPNTVTFPASTTQTFNNDFICTGSAGNIITINSSTPATQATLSKSSGTVSCDYLSLTDSAAAGGAEWHGGANSTAVSNVSGWLDFSANTPPVASSVNIDSSATDVVLTEGTTHNVVCAAVVTDDDGYADITSVTGKFYRSGVADDADDDDANHYTLAGDSECIPSGGSGSTENYTCTFPVQFYADATDSGATYEAENWVCQITPSDAAGVGTAATDTIEMNSLTALSVTAEINYDALALGADTGTSDQTTVVTNTGNRTIDAEVDGYGAIDGDGYSMACTIGNVPIGNEKYSLSASTAYASKTELTDTAYQITTFNLSQGASSTKNIYWGMGLPASGVGSSCAGTVVFTAVNH